MKASEHILEIDIAKGIGIVCVFIGHLTFWGTPVSKFVFGFHLSLFFFLSGLVFLPDKDVRSLVKRLWLSFGVPYLFFSALGLIPYSMGLLGGDPGLGAVLVSTCLRGHPVENGPLWFLVSLAGTQAAYWLLARRIKREILIVMGSLVIALVMILALREFPMGRKWIPLKLETLPLAVFFFSTGRMVSQNVREFIRRSSLFTCVAVSCCALLLMLTILPHTKASCLQGAQIKDGLFFVMSFLGIVFVVSLASAWRSILPKFSGGGGNVLYWAKFVDFLLHGVCYTPLFNSFGKATCDNADCVLSSRASNPIVLFAGTTHFATCNNRFMHTDAFATFGKLAKDDW